LKSLLDKRLLQLMHISVTRPRCKCTKKWR